MSIHIHVDSMKAAEHLSAICKEYPNEFSLRAGQFSIDPKSTLGILAMMYSAKEEMYLDTCDMEEAAYSRFLKSIAAYMVSDDAKTEAAV